jgi:carbonic anhydrase/acetyltransferase-like protein (isoleucine patch superfamily)
MSIRVYKDRRPQFGRGAYIDVDAVIIGDVVIQRGANVWPGAVLRGDVERITVGAETSVQDNAVLHCDPDYPMVIGERAIIGHGAILHGATIGDDVLVGMGSILLNGCVIGAQSIVGAGALVTRGTVVPPRRMVLGSPAKVAREVTQEDLEAVVQLHARYLRRAQELLEIGVGADLAAFRERHG